MDAPIVTGLMAYGMSGRIFHAPFISTNAGFNFKGVVERNEKKAGKIYPDITSYHSIQELLNDDEIELVIVNTPSNLHFEHTLLALNAGKHVLLEKPAAATVAEVKELYDTARRLNKHLMVYQNRRYDSGFLSTKAVIESGRLGNLIEITFRMDRYKAAIGVKSFKETKGVPAGGLVYDLGAHLIDNTIALFGKPLSFHKTTGMYRDGSEVPDYFHYHLMYPNQLNVYLTSGLQIAGDTPGFWVNGTLGSFIKNRSDVQEAQLDKGMMPTDPAYGIEPSGNEGQLTIVNIDNEKCVETVPSVKGDYNQIFEAVYHTIRNNALYPVTEEHIAWQLELLEA
ncbi:Gfo/Idh/MocA family oxidoreductase [Mucilaginibacter phyllosphaerae]|uniref:Dehydrogenase n=1 Tax=Mucilaginibacter phyllosphaerae TaxID=1812349 RepID=A0A4Y8AFW2_9SPHI|nr:Gfo/Idh/MocA family oxidoreductase [Mucilaginibacter phyllosphaerae]MBB3970449.1 putative dehydrogenase [Mucilaginibacter phyllosphaerae]TEW66945.1 oxidoreductase [Mucilaginibacter phyllosphaerae]